MLYLMYHSWLLKDVIFSLPTASKLILRYSAVLQRCPTCLCHYRKCWAITGDGHIAYYKKWPITGDAQPGLWHMILTVARVIYTLL